jgi:cation:H+ antiporter
MNVQTISSELLIIVFLLSAIVIWISGIKLTKAIDAITTHYNLGEAFGGMVFLSIVTNLPEIAITAVAAYHREYTIAISNILGGVAIQTVVLVLIDIFGVGRSAPLTQKGHSKILIVEGLAVIFILCLVLIASQFPATLLYARSTPFEWIILAIWLGTIYMTTSYMLKKKPIMPAQQNSIHRLRYPKAKFQGTITMAMVVLSIGAIITLFAGWGLMIN